MRREAPLRSAFSSGPHHVQVEPIDVKPGDGTADVQNDSHMGPLVLVEANSGAHCGWLAASRRPEELNCGVAAVGPNQIDADVGPAAKASAQPEPITRS